VWVIKKKENPKKVLYAVQKGEPDYMEQIITEHEDRIPEARKWAEENGFDRFRIATYSDVPEMPDFAAAINV